MTDANQVSYFSRLDADECWALLGEAEVGRVAWAGSDGVIIVPVNFRLMGHTIVFHTVQGTALSTLVEPTQIAFQADDIDRESAIGWSVVARGTTGPIDASVPSGSWLEGAQPIGVGVTVASIDGRVVSGYRKNTQEES